MGEHMNDLDRIQKQIGDWAEATFEHTAFGIMTHIREEADELIAAWRDQPMDSVRQEAADIGILLFTLANFLGFSLHDAIGAKHVVNVGRTWVKCDDGITRHSQHAKAPR